MRLHETGSAFDNAIKYRDDFIKWWRAHSVVGGPTQGKDHQSGNDYLLGKIEVVGDNHGFKINCGWKLVIEDHDITQLPFRFGKCSQIRLSANKLATLAGAPEECNLFALERPTDSGGLDGTNSVLESIAHGPGTCEHMAIELARPLRSLHTNFRTPVDSIWIHAPAITSFEGLNVHCRELTCNVPFQKSVTGIHKQLKNVEELALVLPDNFDGGLLCLAMIPGLKRLAGKPMTGSFAIKVDGIHKAFMAINEALTSRMNVHELQEKMIELGLGKFARL